MTARRKRALFGLFIAGTSMRKLAEAYGATAAQVEEAIRWAITDRQRRTKRDAS